MKEVITITVTKNLCLILCSLLVIMFPVIVIIIIITKYLLRCCFCYCCCCFGKGKTVVLLLQTKIACQSNQAHQINNWIQHAAPSQPPSHWQSGQRVTKYARQTLFACSMDLGMAFDMELTKHGKNKFLECFSILPVLVLLLFINNNKIMTMDT